MFPIYVVYDAIRDIFYDHGNIYGRDSIYGRGNHNDTCGTNNGVKERMGSRHGGTNSHRDNTSNKVNNMNMLENSSNNCPDIVPRFVYSSSRSKTVDSNCKSMLEIKIIPVILTSVIVLFFGLSILIISVFRISVRHFSKLMAEQERTYNKYNILL